MTVMCPVRVVTVATVLVGAARMGLSEARSQQQHDGSKVFHVFSVGFAGHGFLVPAWPVAGFTLPFVE